MTVLVISYPDPGRRVNDPSPPCDGYLPHLFTPSPPAGAPKRAESRTCFTSRGRCLIVPTMTEPHGAKWDLETDVVVVGTGAAGLVATLTAHDAGASVV